jgi:dUTP pyrophosphatase
LTYQIKIQPLRDNVTMPKRQTEGSAGIDLYAGGDHAIPSGETRVVECGFAMEVPINMEGQVRPRSGLSSRGILVHFGTIDSDYRGEVAVVLSNISSSLFLVDRNERIAQLVIAENKSSYVSFHVTSVLSPTERGSGGFGSTGKN